MYLMLLLVTTIATIIGAETSLQQLIIERHQF